MVTCSSTSYRKGSRSPSPTAAPPGGPYNVAKLDGRLARAPVVLQVRTQRILSTDVKAPRAGRLPRLGTPVHPSESGSFDGAKGLADALSPHV